MVLADLGAAAFGGPPLVGVVPHKWEELVEGVSSSLSCPKQ
jgi:hypothetical protein